jgi:hypothetical protein
MKERGRLLRSSDGRRPRFGGAVAVSATALVTVAAGGLALASPQLTQEAEVALGSGKPRASTAVRADLVETDPGATPAGNLPAATRIVIRLPAGTRTDTRAAPQCNLSQTQIANGACPPRTIVGRGSAVANVVFGSQGPVTENVQSSVSIHNRRGGIAFRFVSRPTDQLPSVTIVVLGRVSRSGVLTVEVPVMRPLGPESKIVLTELHTTIARRSRLRGGRRRVLILSPRCTRGSWQTRSEFDYDDGSRREVTTTQPCRRPARRG